MPRVREAPRFELPSRWRVDPGECVAGLAWSTGGHLALVTADGRVTSRASGDGAPRWSREAHPGGALGLDASPDGRTLVSAGQDARAALVDASDGSLRGTLPGEARRWVEHAAWSPDGGAVATASGRVVRAWRPDGSPLLETPAHPSTVAALAWRRDGRALAAAHYGGVSLWNLDDRTPGARLAWKASLVSVSWSPDGEVVACGTQDCAVHFWRVRSGRDAEMTGYPFKPTSLAWDAASTMLATSGGVDVLVWRFDGGGPEGTRPLELVGHQAPVSVVAFHPRKAVLASGGQDGAVLLWAPRRGTRPLRYGFVDEPVAAMRWSPSGERLAVADAKGRVACFDVALGGDA